MTGILATEHESLLHCMLPSLWIYHELLTEPGVAVWSSDRLFSLRTPVTSFTNIKTSPAEVEVSLTGSDPKVS